MQSAIKNKKGSIAVLDIGTNKIACFIAELKDDGELYISGIGHHLSKGIRQGIIINIYEAETSILSAVNAAEEMAGYEGNIENIIVSISGNNLQSHHVTIELGISGAGVSERDISDIIREACASVKRKDRSIIHCFANNYYLDGVRGIKDPRGMLGSGLRADMHIITADSVKLHNLANCIGDCHLNVVEFIASPHASALGCLELDEMNLGATVIDIGAGETSVAMFSEGSNIFSSVIPLGGYHITSDLAKGLSTSIASAERIKNLHGSVISAFRDNQDMIEVPIIGDDDNNNIANLVPRANIVNIITPRIEEILEMVSDIIENSGVSQYAGNSIILTGGGSQLMGLREMVTHVFGKQVRIGKPHIISGLADSVSGTAFTASVGMLNYINNKSMEDEIFSNSNKNSIISSNLHKFIDWVKNNF